MSKSPWLREIPKAHEILNEVLERLNKEIDFSNKVRNGKISLSEAVTILERECHRCYREYEYKVKEKFLKLNVDPTQLEKSLMQSRAARAGETIERIFQTLLEITGIPCERNVWYPKRNGELLDIIVPDRKTLLRDPGSAIVISIKRKVRERWREVIGEAYILRQIHGVPDNIWFVTASCDVSEYVIKTIAQLGIRAYVPKECYNDFKQFGARCLSDLIDDIIDFLKRKGLRVSL